jgi:hypothetical protein
MELAFVRRCGSLSSTRDVAVLINFPPQPTAMERVPRTLVVDARYVERVVVSARVDLDVASLLLSSRLDLD